ncbi:RNA polymerase sigma-70 factor [Cytophagaceae bacterium DM2B3-1]|uniref:RNA polymerase sigma-70 factor n=1 Tax=Xanthocytophaga flava TaxID=3048013 RepID=A0ABT7CTD6_9BACT|nr:RNA polymerase sigma-70 factor [Xanthocytophaga flavus]MDJ1496222.1 RNA polymerase sigma-70 factor [Xanthocytophaga flavus]
MKLNTIQIRDLQERICNNDQEAFAALYRLFFMRLFQFTKMYVHNRETAEELVNDIMLKLWHRRSEVLKIQNLETYLFVSARNKSLNYLSQRSPFHISLEPESGEIEIVNTDDPEKILEWRQIYELLMQAVEELPDQCRTVFKLIKEEGMSYKQVAEILDLSPRTVETQLFRAMKKLHKSLDNYMDTNTRYSKLPGSSILPPESSIVLLILFLDFI